MATAHFTSQRTHARDHKVRKLWLWASAFLVLSSTLLFAHAILVEASPTANATIVGPSTSIKLRFNVRIDAKRSRLALVLPDMSESLLTITQPSPDILQTQAAGLKAGSYAIRWQVLASDGHITRGEIPFKVQN